MYNLFKKLLPLLKSTFFGTPTTPSVSGGQNKIYIRFAIVNDLMGTVRNAELHLVVAENDGGTSVVEVYGLNNNDAGEVWDENTITFNNGPANDTANDFIAARVTLLGSFNVYSTDVVGTLKIFTSSDMITWLNADTNDTVTFLLRRTDSNFGSSLCFASGESTTYEGPKLVINKDTTDMYIKGKDDVTDNYQNLYSHGF